MKVRDLAVYFSLLFCGVIVGFLLLVLSFLLPTSRMTENVEASCKQLMKEGISPNVLENYETTRLDNYSDGLILNSAIYNGKESVVEKASAIYQYTYDGENYYQSLFSYIDGKTDMIRGSYARDWHGYLVYVKPLLLFFNYNEIRMLNLFLQCILITFIILEMKQKQLDKYIIAFILFLFFMSFHILYLSLEYSALFYVILLAVIIMLQHSTKLYSSNKIYSYFIIIGMCTCYIDVLTYPILTLGIPLVYYFILNNELCICTKKSFYEIINNSFAWAFGYIGMWTGKWIIATIFTDDNVIKEGILTVLYRMSEEASDTGTLEYFNTIDVLRRNFGVYAKIPYFVVLTAFLTFILVRAIRIRFNSKRTNLLPFVLIAIMPIAWYIAIGNHSYIHYWMTHRDLVLILFSTACMLLKITDQRKIIK